MNTQLSFEYGEEGWGMTVLKLRILGVKEVLFVLEPAASNLYVSPESSCANETSFVYRVQKNDSSPQSADTPSLTTFFSSSPDVSPKEYVMPGTIHDYRRDLGCLDTSGAGMPSVSRHPPPAVVSNAEIAPWAVNDGRTASKGGVTSESFYDDGHGKFQISPSFQPDTGGAGTSGSPDRLSYGDERRPSIASATTISSQNSNTNSRASVSKGTRRSKMAGFFSDDGNGRASSRSSDTSILTTGQKGDSTSSFLQRDRSNSVNAFNHDGRPLSPGNSRPRTPLPSSDVTPWLFQNFNVSPNVCVSCVTQSLLFGVTVYIKTQAFAEDGPSAS